MEIDAEKLIVLIEERPALYNYTLKEHHLKDVVEKLWDEVAKEVGDGVTGADCKTKWTVLRSSYVRYIREIKKRPSGSAASKKKKWYLADSMSFMQAFVGQHKKPIGNVFVNDEDVDEMSPSISLEDELPGETINRRNEGDTSPTIAFPTQEINDTHGQKTVSGTQISQTPNKRKVHIADKIAGPMIEFLKKRTQQETSVDPNLKFFESIIPDMEKLSSKRKRVFKMQVMESLHGLLQDQENEELIHAFTPSTPSPLTSVAYVSTPSSSASTSTQCQYTTAPNTQIEMYESKAAIDSYAEI